MENLSVSRRLRTYSCVAEFCVIDFVPPHKYILASAQNTVSVGFLPVAIPLIREANMGVTALRLGKDVLLAGGQRIALSLYDTLC